MALPVRQSDDRQRVLDATDIVPLIAEHINLRPKGRELVGLCPFHDDHSPSMCVVPHKQMYHCFSCGTGGNAFSFVMGYHKMGFREALEYLATRAGLTLTPSRPGGHAEDAPAGGVNRREILAANSTAQEFFRVVLRHAEHGRAARALVERRGISPQMAEAFGLGASPDRWDGLASTIAGKRLATACFEQAGLVRRREHSGGLYDVFRNRLMFPIQDQLGRIVAFGGRRLGDGPRADGTEEVKYLNSPESAVFEKSATLYGLHQAAQAIRRGGMALVTEGYLDVIACHQAGFTHAVATLGTALTAGHARLLRRLCDRVVLLFDGDEAGQRAALRGVEVFFAEQVDLRIAALRPHTDAKDPDELLKRPGGSEVLAAVIAAAVDPLTLLLGKMRADLAGKGVSAASRVTEEFVGRLAELGLGKVEPMRRELIVRRLAEMTGSSRGTLQQVLGEKAGRPRAPADRGASPAPAAARTAATEDERLLGCILAEPALVRHDPEEADLTLAGRFGSEPVRRVAAAAEELIRAEAEPDIAGVLARLDDQEAQQAATALTAHVMALGSASAGGVRGLWAEWVRDRARRRALEEAGLEAGALGPSPGVTAPGGGWDRAVGALAVLREVRAAVGDDPRAIPRPL